MKGRVRKPCPGRADAIAGGMKLPPTAAEFQAKAEILTNPEPSNKGKMTAFFESKLPFNNLTLNHLLVLWLLYHGLPWNRIEDKLLRIAFRYARRDCKIFGRCWVAREAKDIYFSLQDTSLAELKVGLLISRLTRLVC